MRHIRLVRPVHLEWPLLESFPMGSLE